MSISTSCTSNVSPTPTSVDPPQTSTASVAPRQFAPKLKQIPVTTHAGVPFSIEASACSQHLAIPSNIDIPETGSTCIDVDNFAKEWKHYSAQQFHRLRQQHYKEPCQGLLSIIEQHPDKPLYRGLSVSDTVAYQGQEYQDVAEFVIRSGWIPHEEFATYASAKAIQKEYVELRASKARSLGISFNRSAEDFDLIDSVINNSKSHAAAAQIVFDSQEGDD